MSHKYFYEIYGGRRKKKKKEVVGLKGNCRASIGGSLPHPKENGHQMAKHQNRSTMKKNTIE